MAVRRCTAATPKSRLIARASVSKSRALLACAVAAKMTLGCGAHAPSPPQSVLSAVDVYRDEIPDTTVTATLPTRSADTTRFAWVGVLLDDGVFHCSGALLRHGLFVTARHCGLPMQRATIVLPASGSFDLASPGAMDVIIKPGDLRQAVADIDGQDVVYYLYDPEVTLGRVEIGVTTAQRPAPATRELAVMVSFPQPLLPPTRVISEPCEFTGGFGPHGYYGDALFDTTCRGWYGGSGGAVFSFIDGKLGSLVGVVSHTFNVDASDAPVVEGTDLFGPYVSVNVSTFATATKLEAMVRSLASP